MGLLIQELKQSWQLPDDLIKETVNYTVLKACSLFLNGKIIDINKYLADTLSIPYKKYINL